MDPVLSDFKSCSENYRRPPAFRPPEPAVRPGRIRPSTQTMHMMTPPVTVITSKAAVPLN